MSVKCTSQRGLYPIEKCFKLLEVFVFFSNLHPLDVLSVCVKEILFLHYLLFAVSAEGRGLGYAPDVCTNLPSQKAKFIVHVILIQSEM